MLSRYVHLVDRRSRSHTGTLTPLLLLCLDTPTGFVYRLKVSSSLDPKYTATQLCPRIQVFAGDALVHESTQTNEAQWRTHFYWHVCSWSADGAFQAHVT